MPDNTKFLYGLQTDGLCHDWLPWKQSRYIQECLHNDFFSTKSRHAAGLCAVIGAYVLSSWLKTKKFDTAPILEIEKPEVAEVLDGWASEPGAATGPRFERFMATTGFPKGIGVEVRNSTGAIAFASIGCAIWLGGMQAQGDGHSIVGAGQSFVLFDPNVGYMRCRNRDAYIKSVDRLMTDFYPALPRRAVVTFNAHV